MKLIIAGSRWITEYSFVTKGYKEFRKFYGPATEIVSGLSSYTEEKGVDYLAFKLSQDLSLPFTPFPADWNRYGKKAGPIRNEHMALYGNFLLAVWDGKSPGTLDMISQMKKVHKSLLLLLLKEPPTFIHSHESGGFEY